MVSFKQLPPSPPMTALETQSLVLKGGQLLGKRSSKEAEDIHTYSNMQFLQQQEKFWGQRRTSLVSDKRLFHSTPIAEQIKEDEMMPPVCPAPRLPEKMKTVQFKSETQVRESFYVRPRSISTSPGAERRIMGRDLPFGMDPATYYYFERELWDLRGYQSPTILNEHSSPYEKKGVYWAKQVFDLYEMLARQDREKQRERDCQREREFERIRRKGPCDHCAAREREESERRAEQALPCPTPSLPPPNRERFLGKIFGSKRKNK